MCRTPRHDEAAGYARVLIRRFTSASAAVRLLLYSEPELIESGFRLTHRHIRSVTQFKASLHQDSRRVTRHCCAASHFCWEHRAAVEMRSDAVGQVRLTAWACV